MRRLIPFAVLMVTIAGCRQQPDPPAGPPTATPSTPVTAASTPARAVDLSRYAGSYPTEAVRGGTSFLGDPAVRAAVATIVADAGLRREVLGADVTATPIATVDGKLLAFACEPHNCGPHNWAVAIRADGSDPAVCYYDRDRRVARWYPEDAAPAPTNGCPSGE